VLHGIQDAIGMCRPIRAADRGSSEPVAAEVHGVISFYHYFRSTGRAGTRFTCAGPSHARPWVPAHWRPMLGPTGVDYHQTTADGSISLEPVYCLGQCACSRR